MSILNKVIGAFRRSYKEMVRANAWSSPYFVEAGRCSECNWPHTFERKNNATGEKERWCCNCRKRK